MPRPELAVAWQARISVVAPPALFALTAGKHAGGFGDAKPGQEDVIRIVGLDAARLSRQLFGTMARCVLLPIVSARGIVRTWAGKAKARRSAGPSGSALARRQALL
jgi:hypothetical protein